ncbi:hypothetical protein ACFXKG_35905 [Streptomyces sp. NPDC059255]|uniref:hypothetical protein n=1 Tax=Streptomyces sp. NPDC059255 TaxID=3346793 RepID=UPI00368434AC
MQRTRSVAMVLLGMAVTAVSGCVAVGPRPPQDPRPTPPATAPAPGPGGVEPQVVQSPVKEALERMTPTPKPPASPGASHPALARETGGGTASPRHAPAPAPPEHGRGRLHERPHEAPRRPPAAPLPSVPALADLCAFGEGYARWPADSPQAGICRGT